jgi:hypothetical protein
MENVPPLLYELLEHSHALLDHTLVFQRKENLGLFNVQTLIHMLTYGCLEGLSKVITNLILILILYVDDLFITRNDKQGVAQFKFQFMAQFCMTDLGPLQKYLGVKFKCTTHGLLFH